MEFVEEFSSVETSIIEEEFSRLKGVHYLDSAGSVPYGEGQVKQICNLLTSNLFCNPHTSRATENVIDQVRYR
jgi:molybdenum cofactor sulfurtransferase